MKTLSLAEKILKYMVTEYQTNDKLFFSMETLKEKFPDYKIDYLSKVMYSLQSDGFVNVIPADNCAHISELLIDGIINCEEDTLLKRGYSVLKELRTLLP